MTEKEMQLESIRIISRFQEEKIEKGAGMVILAMTLAITFKEDGVPPHEAINRFTTIVKNVYGSAP